MSEIKLYQISHKKPLNEWKCSGARKSRWVAVVNEMISNFVTRTETSNQIRSWTSTRSRENNTIYNQSNLVHYSQSQFRSTLVPTFWKTLNIKFKLWEIIPGHPCDRWGWLYRQRLPTGTPDGRPGCLQDDLETLTYLYVSLRKESVSRAIVRSDKTALVPIWKNRF